jgi:nitrogen-specific signal transduction histidine kinase
MRYKFRYTVPQLKILILGVIGVLLIGRGYNNRAWMFDLIEGRKPYDADLIASIGGLVGAPSIVGAEKQLEAINDYTRHAHRSTRVLISDKIGSYRIDNRSVVSEGVVPVAVTENALDYWRKVKGLDLLEDGRSWEQEGHHWHMIVRPFTLGQSKLMWVVLISNLDKSIDEPWKDNVAGLIVLAAAIAAVTGMGGLLITIPARAIAKGIEQDRSVVAQWWWAEEFKVLAAKFNKFAIKESQGKEQLENTNSKLEKMYRALRHDIISAVGGVQNMFQMLTDMGFSPAEEYSEFYNLAVSKSHLAYTLVSSTGKLGQALNIETVDLSEVFNDLKVIYAGNNITFKPLPEPISIKVDKSIFLLKVLGNLVTNAIKYSSPPNEEIEIGAIAKSHEIVIYVKDNGSGLTAEEITKILTNYGASARLNPKIPGSGTGLSTVQDIIKQLGFELGVKSQKGTGSIFFIKIPKQL